MKKTLSALLASTVISMSAVPVFAANTFSDVTKSNEFSWAYEYVENMSSLGLIKGYEDGTFKPSKQVSRMDAFALFARLMGSNNELNAEFLESAKEQYKDILASYALSYVEGDVAYLMARGVLTQDELNTYFQGNKKTEPMPRSEAVVLITKAMLSEQTAKNEVLVDLDFTDVAQIPKAAKQYVYFVSQKGIIKGMADGSFSPNTAVTRAEIAVMLSKTCDIVNYSFDLVTIVSIDETSRNIKIKDQDGEKFTIGYTDDARFYVGGELTVPSKVKAGKTAVLTYIVEDDEPKLAFLDTVEEKIEVEETKAVIFKSYQTKGNTMFVNCIDVALDTTDAYPCDSDVSVLIDGAESNINKLKDGDYVTIGLNDDTIVQISAMQKNTTIEAVIEQISTLGTITISSDEEEFNGITLSVDKDAIFNKNGDSSNFAALGRGDKVKLTLEYGIVTRVVSTSATKTVTGTLTSYTIAGTPTITITKDGATNTYDVSPSATVKIGTEDAKLSDFAIGANLTLTVESDVVKKISAADSTSTVTADNISGVVTAKYDKLITLSVPEKGDGFTITITCADSARYIQTPTLENTELKKIQIGDTITAYGSYKNGIFVSTGVLVSSKK